jgi:ribose transport system substrate-binding protein
MEVLMSFRKGLLLVLVGVLSLTLFITACNKKAKSGKVFGATYMTLNNPFFGALNNGIKEVVEANGDEVIALDPSLDQAKQIAQVEDMISQGVSAIFLNPVDWKGVKPALDAAKKAGIPIINVDAPVFDDKLVNAIVASDNYNAGVLCAKDMMKKMKSAKIVILEHPTAKSAIDRTEGFINTIKGNKNYQIIAKQSSEGQLEQAMPIMENIIQAQPKIDVVMALNDPTALGALAALKAAKREKGVLLYGVDGAPGAKKSIKEGKMTASAAQSPIGIGKTAAKIAYDILADKTVKKLTLVPVILIDKNNVSKYGTDGWQ